VLVRPRLGRLRGPVAAFAGAFCTLVTAPPAAASTSDLAPVGVCPGQDDPAAAPAVKAAAMHCLVNWARKHRGMVSLRDSRLLDRSSLLRASAIRRCQDFSHTPCGQPFMRVFARVGYPRAATVGENLFWGGGPLGSARNAFQGWLNSPGHRHIVFMRGWRGLGIGLVSADQLFGAAQVSVWVAQFGSR
jgi:uncharacterized protein YkwD